MGLLTSSIRYRSFFGCEGETSQADSASVCDRELAFLRDPADAGVDRSFSYCGPGHQLANAAQSKNAPMRGSKNSVRFCRCGARYPRNSRGGRVSAADAASSLETQRGAWGVLAASPFWLPLVAAKRPRERAQALIHILPRGGSGACASCETAPQAAKHSFRQD
jgi:hypothetical protein